MGEGAENMLVMTDCVIEAAMGHVLATYDNLEILHEIMPEF